MQLKEKHIENEEEEEEDVLEMVWGIRDAAGRPH
jgi:hypothetical protein